MDPVMQGTLIVAGAAVIGFFVTFLIGRKAAAKTLAEAEDKVKGLLAGAEKEANAIKKEKLLEAKEEIAQERRKAESERDSRESKIRHQEKELRKREEAVADKYETIAKKEKQIAQQDAEVQKRWLQAKRNSKRSTLSTMSRIFDWNE